MHNDNNICFECRKTFRRNGFCPECGKELVFASHIVRAPKSKHLNRWNKFTKWLKEVNSYYREEIKRIYDGKY